MYDWHDEVQTLMARFDLANDTQLATFLGLSKQQISGWRNGTTELGPITRLVILDKLGYIWAVEALAAVLPAKRGRALLLAEKKRARKPL